MENSNINILVIGGGIVGSAIAYKLSQYDKRIMLIEKQPNVCEGTSKANSAIIHTGFDAPPNTIESQCLMRSRELWPKIIEDHRIAYEERGAIMVAFTKEEKEKILKKYKVNAEQNNVEVEWLTKEKVLKNNPAVSEQCVGGLLIPKESIIDPFEAVYSLAEGASFNGVEVKTSVGVKGIEKVKNKFVVQLEDETLIESDYVVNAAGLYTDEIAAMIGDTSFEITPRKGQFIVSKSKVDISNIILPVPSEKSKGKLMTPAVFGGFLFGPTAEDVDEKNDRSVTYEGLEEILAGCESMVPDVRSYQTVRQYAGVRAVNEDGDYIIRSSKKAKHMIHVAGIRSTGLSASPGIAEVVFELLQSLGCSLEKNQNWNLNYPIEDVTNQEDIICLCKSVQRKTVTEALQRPLAAQTLDDVKRRTHAMLGSCQGSCCIPKILDVMEEHQQNDDLPKKGPQNSEIGLKRKDVHV